ncbi:MAG TPA: hypothetical protein VIE44_17795 [Methylomirabilota bacterium]
MLRRYGGTLSIGTPSKATDPASWGRSPATMRSSVVFPHPLGPSKV